MKKENVFIVFSRNAPKDDYIYFVCENFWVKVLDNLQNKKKKN